MEIRNIKYYLKTTYEDICMINKYDMFLPPNKYNRKPMDDLKNIEIFNLVNCKLYLKL
jgi:hypothetical protein